MTITALFLGIAFAVQGEPLTPKLKPAPVTDQVVVKINGVEIKSQDIQDLLWDLHGATTMAEVVNYQLIKQEAARLKIVVTDQEVEKEVAIMGEKLQPGLTPGQILAQNGYTWNLIYIRAKSTLMLLKIALQEFKPTDYIQLSTIIIRPKSTSDSDIALTTKVVQDIHERLMKGESWEKLVTEYVTEPESRRTNGYLGWRELLAFDETARKDVALLKRGEYSKPIRTANGVQIFRIEMRGIDASGEELAQMKDDVIDQIQQSVVRRLMRAAKIERLYPQ
jgi:foldase protein PrsA